MSRWKFVRVPRWACHPKRNTEFEPRSDGGFERIEAIWNGCQWRVTGEVVMVVGRV
ncbi:hypothetical protein [Haloarcula vallismortis]|uniref:hypothetical protein n=1 Tax=Haloarcula vallismortis TaxID=28442 RepID=UPI00146134D6|nr:hypothetical protein [Haloarcula vallismortis]